MLHRSVSQPTVDHIGNALFDGDSRGDIRERVRARMLPV